MEYKVGDLVRINNRSDSEYGNIYPIVAIGENSEEIKVRLESARYKWYRKEDLFLCNKVKGEIEMKYKVGDKVRVHTKAWFEKNCMQYDTLVGYRFANSTNTFNSEMEIFCGQEVTIKHIDSINNYEILEDGGLWTWEDWMFESMNNSTTTISNPNIVEDFAKLIGVGLDEEFYDKDSSWAYKFTANIGLMVYDDDREEWRVASAYPVTAFLKMVKEGKFTKNWIPQDKDRVYFPVIVSDTLCDDTIYHKGNVFDEEMLKKGLYFRTQEEAVECAKKILKQMKEG